MIHEEEPAAVDDDAFEDSEADFAEPGPVDTYVLSTRLPGVVGGPS